MKKALSEFYELPIGFVDVKTIIPDIIADLPYFGSNNFVGRPIKGYQKKRILLTLEATQALAKVQDELRKLGLGLLIYDAYRPVQAVEDFVAWGKDTYDIKTKNIYYPDLEKHELFEQGYINQHSTHSRGSTVDLTIIPLPINNNIHISHKNTNNYQSIDMGGYFDFFGQLSHSNYIYISPQQRANRLLLQIVMKKYNFIPLDKEWWHFTLSNEPFPNTYFDFPIR